MVHVYSVTAPVILQIFRDATVIQTGLCTSIFSGDTVQSETELYVQYKALHPLKFEIFFSFHTNVMYKTLPFLYTRMLYLLCVCFTFSPPPHREASNCVFLNHIFVSSYELEQSKHETLLGKWQQ